MNHKAALTDTAKLGSQQNPPDKAFKAYFEVCVCFREPAALICRIGVYRLPVGTPF
jgi:hypothetical protein